jgi:hypothetical protein
VTASAGIEISVVGVGFRDGVKCGFIGRKLMRIVNQSFGFCSISTFVSDLSLLKSQLSLSFWFSEFLLTSIQIQIVVDSLLVLDPSFFPFQRSICDCRNRSFASF